MHEIETHGDQAAAIFARKSAWHQLGTTVDGTFTAEEAMKIGHLGGWNVRKLPVPPIYDEATGQWLETDQDFLIARTSPFTDKVERLGRVGSDYTVIQNEEHAEFLNTLAAEGGAHFETAGSLKGGRQTFLTMKLPEHFLVGGQDRHELYLAASNSHDGTSPFTVMLTPIRIVCANTQSAAIRGAKHIFKIRHTSGATSRVQEARQILDLSFKYVEKFEAEANRMIEAELSEQDFRKILEELIVPSDAKSVQALKNAAARQQSVVELFKHSPTVEKVKGTRWAGYNAFTEYTDHFAPVQAKNGQDDARANRVLTSHEIPKLKAKAFDLLSV
jgi:phage/plasmid-like protein (TIGR03299 family)